MTYNVALLKIIQQLLERKMSKTELQVVISEYLPASFRKEILAYISLTLVDDFDVQIVEHLTKPGLYYTVENDIFADLYKNMKCQGILPIKCQRDCNLVTAESSVCGEFRLINPKQITDIYNSSANMRDDSKSYIGIGDMLRNVDSYLKGVLIRIRSTRDHFVATIKRLPSALTDEEKSLMALCAIFKDLSASELAALKENIAKIKPVEKQ